jgi:hypothetical protein
MARFPVASAQERQTRPTIGETMILRKLRTQKLAVAVGVALGVTLSVAVVAVLALVGAG